MDNVGVEDNEFSFVVDTLVNMFGNILTKDVITAVVENCAGDLNLSAEAIMNMTDGHTSDNTHPVAVPPNKPAEEINLITFNNADDNIEPKDNNQSYTNESNISSISEAEVISTPLKPPEVKSTFNVEATAYVPRSMLDRMMPAEATASQNTTSKVYSENLPTLMPNNPSVISNQAETNQNTTDDTFESLISYSGMTRKTGALPKKPVKTAKHEIDTKLPPKLRDVVDYHNKGFRILIIMRGVPGSGKSYLSRQVIQATIGDSLEHFKCHILSTDDFFHSMGGYEFNKVYLSQAHAWNQQRAKSAMERGLSPIIIDNTNIEMWEMEPYVRSAVSNGYKIITMEPKTPWAKKPSQLLRKNIHGVKLPSIIRMLDNFTENITGDYLINYYKLSYPDRMTPPILRNNPPVVPDDRHCITKGVRMVNKTKQKSLIHEQQTNDEMISSQTSNFIKLNIAKDDAICNDSEILSIGTVNSNESVNLGQNLVVHKAVVSENTTTEIITSANDKNEDSEQDCYLKIKQQLEELEKLDIAWENSEGWDEKVKNENNKINSNTANEPKPQRENIPNRSGCDEKLMNDINHCQDWTKISMFMPPWVNESHSVEKEVVPPVEMISSGTCVEFGDTDIYNNTQIFKIISATARDINEHYISPHREKIPEKRMLDKSSMTNERSITENFRCKNEERHFTAFRKMFKSIPKSDLRDIFTNCGGDVNWAVGIVLDGISNNQLTFMETLDLSDAEEEISEQCTCLAAYNILPDMEIQGQIDTHGTESCIDQNIPDTSTDNVVQFQRKPKKEISVSDISMQLKRQIEQNVVISDNHYSMHCLKIRKVRRGEGSVKITEVEDDNQEETENASALVPFEQTDAQESANIEISDDESNVSVDDLEKIVNVHVGKEFIQSMDELFGRRGITYPENVVPRLSIPISLANELNALWMESLMHQLDEYEKQSAAMLKQDEEFARQLAMKEMELAQEGKEPEVPDFKEIMDMDFAMSIYQKDVAEWRSKEPNNWAARLTRDKLFNLFPEVPQDTLSELLVAHDNNFKATVEVLLMSTGKSDILEQKNGLVKFVMAKEFKRQEEIMQEQKKVLSEVEWPVLPKGEAPDMSVVTKYRDTAEKHLLRRNLCHNKAQDYFRRGMTTVATYYTDVASFHKNMFDQANSLAAASLMQIHALRAPDNATIDLHYLRVGEARESLDLFLDSHINKLRELRSQNRGPRQQALFFITGRGLHSQGGPKVKPAVKKRLRERGITCHERNPGLLFARVTADDKLTYQVEL